MSALVRVALDTNVVLSALLFGGGAAGRVRRAWQQGMLLPLASTATVQEIVRVLAYPKFRLSQAEQDELLADYLPYTQIVRIPQPPPQVPKCRDVHDEPFMHLAVAGKARHPGLPGVPTTSEAGLKGFELEAWVGIFAPVGTPPDVVAKLSGLVKSALELPETKTRADAAGIELRYQPPAALDALVAKETEFWAKTIKSAGIKAD